MKKGVREFGRLLARLREDAGYRAPRAFHEAAALGCALAAYVDAERGRAVPSPALAEKIAAGLRLGLDRESGAEFARAYLRALFGGDEFLDFASWALRRDAPLKRRRTAPAPAAAGGEAVLDHPFVIRASRAELLDYAPFLERALGDAAAAGRAKGEKFVLEARITELLPF